MEDITESTDNSGIDYTDSKISIIPREIMSRIFAFLPLADRKCVRHVSRLWYDCSICADIVKHEKFVFRTGFSIEDVNEVMLQSNYPLMNLEFQSMPARDLPVDFWRVCGQRIRTLEFSRGQWHDKIISDIILYCENLTSFVLRMSPRFLREHRSTWMMQHLERLLDELIKKGIRRPTLHTFLIFSDDIQFPERVLRKIVILYPRIEQYNVATVSFTATFTCSPMSYFVESPLLRRLYQCLDSASRSDIPRYANSTWMETLTEKAEERLRLKQLSLKLFYERRMKYTVLNFFTSQRNIEVLDFLVKVDDYRDDAVKCICRLFFHVLESCPNLKEYRFRDQLRALVFLPEELPRFLNSISKLKFLSLKFEVPYTPHVPSYHDLLSNSVHFNLTSLEWLGWETDSNFSAVFIQRCSSLRHLKLAECYDITLQTIFQYLVELRTLVLLNGRMCTNFGFTGRDVNGEETGYSINRLQQLKCLELLYFTGIHLEKVALELHSPRLEFLSLRQGFYLHLSEEDSSRLEAQLPKLRVFAIEQVSDECSIEKTAQFCKRFKNLHRLISFINEGCTCQGYWCQLNKRLVDNLFNACPSLRYISGDGDITFVRNPFTGKVFRKASTDFNFTGNIFKCKFPAHPYRS